MGNSGKPELRRYFFDTEFVDTPAPFSNMFISIGIVDEDGREYYGISSEFNQRAVPSWVKEHVVGKLDDKTPRSTIATIRENILGMVAPAKEVEFWAKNGSYDNVMLCQIFGGMNNMRKAFAEHGVERITFRDIKELKRIAPDYPAPPPLPEEKQHIAINDARHEKVTFESFLAHTKKPGFSI